MGRFQLKVDSAPKVTGALMIAVRFEGEDAERLRAAAERLRVQHGTVVKRMVRHCLADLDRSED